MGLPSSSLLSEVEIVGKVAVHQIKFRSGIWWSSRWNNFQLGIRWQGTFNVCSANPLGVNMYKSSTGIIILRDLCLNKVNWVRC